MSEPDDELDAVALGALDAGRRYFAGAMGPEEEAAFELLLLQRPDVAALVDADLALAAAAPAAGGGAAAAPKPRDESAPDHRAWAMAATVLLAVSVGGNLVQAIPDDFGSDAAEPAILQLFDGSVSEFFVPRGSTEVDTHPLAAGRKHLLLLPRASVSHKLTVVFPGTDRIRSVTVSPGDRDDPILPLILDLSRVPEGTELHLLGHTEGAPIAIVRVTGSGT
jgi:hypothetical protein